MARTLFDTEDDVAASIDRDIELELQRWRAHETLRRNSDPATSGAAAKEIAGRVGSMQRWVLSVVREYPGSTASELAQVKSIGDPRIINRRLPELEVLQLVRRGEEKKCDVTGKAAATWFAL